ncbi:hypothetical protein OIU76_010608 [Salix suchowensis]|nr:hypothetical protein OIU76_010608 [Salix suchowensis]
MFGRALTSVLWGVIADRYGRKPVIMFGTISVHMLQKFAVKNIKLWECQLSAHHGVLDESLVLLLEDFLLRFPYLLPCLLISIFSVGVFVVCCFLPETLHIHVGNGEESNDSEALGAAAFESNSLRKAF